MVLSSRGQKGYRLYCSRHSNRSLYGTRPKDRPIPVRRIVAFPIVQSGHFDMQNGINTSEYDRVNKQEFVKDLQMKCFKGDLTGDVCKGL